MNEIIKEISQLLKNSEDYGDYSLEYILIDKEETENSIAVAMYGEDIIQINITSHEISSIPDWAYNFDEDIFGMLEDNKEIGYMSMNTHFNIWETINQWYPEDIENKQGMQKYLKYCKNNKITKEVIEKEVKLDVSIDVMKFYEKEEKQKKKNNDRCF